ncbi:hypothetical protein E3Q22_02555 [Wallemia mellicola]|uniref:Small ribosomal subunit protein mS35 mitochondrial conserved domain-containing protein n=1 Tax=Wallemia mellicola TaxID=1708541 RepID=A0A4T0S171_9BASI|nr:hypothetical protein E3Q22_02555 [Wallemia mellicola]TIB79290.1 hypothetical protein E3Q23_00302 [Wallemia mellicola]TIB87395.1 hypothetical protein E3Q21_01315 [Wallemia mellicola]TIB90341.1 hypothetical protein E3Q20_01302 [Wallemia mellicola]TIB97924.1 hypothetical protein E3Q18_02348 [Wallemia mellicola]
MIKNLRLFSSSCRTQAVLGPKTSKKEVYRWESSKPDDNILPKLEIESKRRWLAYMRMEEFELPKLEKYRKEFKPPAKDEVVKVRTLDYLNQEPHPASVKSVVTVKVSDLPLADASSKHKLKLLAGPRWSGPESRIVDGKLVEDVDGEIKISSEQFPYRAQNMRWCSDKLQLLLKESNDKSYNFDDIPLDTRHVTRRIRKSRRGGHRLENLAGAQQGRRPTKFDMPESWIEEAKSALILTPPVTPMFNEMKDTPENLSSFVQTFIASIFPPSKKQMMTNLYTPPASPASSQFNTGPHSDLYEFAHYIITRAELCTEAALSALALLARLRRKLPRARAESGPRLFLAAMIVASKGLFDIAYNNPGWYEIAAGCPAIEADFALADINLMERQLLSHLDYRVAVFGDEIIALRRIYMTGQIQQQTSLVKSASTNTSINSLLTPPPSPLDLPVEQVQAEAPPPRPLKSRLLDGEWTIVSTK